MHMINFRDEEVNIKMDIQSACGETVTYIPKQEAHGPHRSPEKTVQINKHI